MTRTTSNTTGMQNRAEPFLYGLSFQQGYFLGIGDCSQSAQICYNALVTVPQVPGWREETRLPRTITGPAKIRSYPPPPATASTRPGRLPC